MTIRIAVMVLSVCVLMLIVDKSIAANKEPGSRIPDRLVVLTFDDSAVSHATIVAPLLKKHGFGGTFFITEGFRFTTNKKNYMTWAQIKELHDAGFEIGNHTRRHKGVNGQKPDQIDADVAYIEQQCVRHGITKPMSFCYPGYATSNAAVKVLGTRGYRFARTGGARAFDPVKDNPLLMPQAFDGKPGSTFDQFVAATARAKNGKIAVMTFHGIPDKPHPWVSTTAAKFEQYMKHLADEGCTVIAMRDLAKYLDAPGSASASRTKRVVPWDIPALSKAPKIHETTERPAKGMRAFFYEGANYKGKPTRVFAYYATPEGEPPTGGWPAVVCAHGGGGTAYPQWVKFWTSNGYAAIAMDLEGHLPGGNSHHVEGNFPTNVGHQNAGPSRIDWFGDRDLPDREQWFYHAVADVIRANSLLRSFREINPKKIGLTGISWGGTIVSTVAGVDSRFAFVIPVYGAGFIHESDNPGLAQWFPPKNMTAKQFQDYRTKWDPSAHLPHAKMPMLFVSSVADPVFQIDIFSKSVEAAGQSRLCIRPWMIHAHGSGWDDAIEIRSFANSIVKGGPPLPEFGRPEINSGTGKVHTKYKGDITEAWVYLTTSSGPWKNRKWHFIQCNLGKGELISRKALPKGMTGYLVYGFRAAGGGRSNHVSSELVVVKP